MTAEVQPQVDDRGNLSAKGTISYSGLALYYLFYLEVGGAGAENKKNAETAKTHKAKGRAWETKSEKKYRVYEDKLDDPCVLLDPWEWSWTHAD